jgi:hypothetical protein
MSEYTAPNPLPPPLPIFNGVNWNIQDVVTGGGPQGFQGVQGVQGIGTASTIPGPQGAQGVQGTQGAQGGFHFTRGTTFVSFAGPFPYAALITHDLGTTPTSILLTDGDGSHSPAGNILTLGVNSKNSTTFGIVASDLDTSIYQGTRFISWMAIA